MANLDVEMVALLDLRDGLQRLRTDILYNRTLRWGAQERLDAHCRDLDSIIDRLHARAAEIDVLDGKVRTLMDDVAKVTAKHLLEPYPDDDEDQDYETDDDEDGYCCENCSKLLTADELAEHVDTFLCSTCIAKENALQDAEEREKELEEDA